MWNNALVASPQLLATSIVMFYGPLKSVHCTEFGLQSSQLTSILIGKVANCNEFSRQPNESLIKDCKQLASGLLSWILSRVRRGERQRDPERVIRAPYFQAYQEGFWLLF